MSRVVFLDYDGVVNRKMWELVDGKYVFRFGYPEDGKVNDSQAVQWVSEFCEKYGYDIVVTSTWRKYPQWDNCLRTAGLRDNIKILGATSLPAKDRAEEIGDYLNQNPQIESYLIFDDKKSLVENDTIERENVPSDLASHVVLCKTELGFGEKEYLDAVSIHLSQKYANFASDINEEMQINKSTNISSPVEEATIDLLYGYGRISTSLLQRCLKLGYGKAARVIDLLVQLKIVRQSNSGGSVRYLPNVEYKDALNLLGIDKADKFKEKGSRRVIFLDIDGVLNSLEYDRERTKHDGNIDKTRLVLLRSLINATNAEVVLTSSWRTHWASDIKLCDEVGRELISTFAEYGIKISDKTDVLSDKKRPDEIRAWLCEHEREIDRFVIIDDSSGCWGELEKYLVRTDFQVGRGLEERHIAKAKKILLQE